jgi:hypothetical protein
LPQAHVVPAFDHLADFDFVGIAYVCVSHRFLAPIVHLYECLTGPHVSNFQQAWISVPLYRGRTIPDARKTAAAVAAAGIAKS